jgi:hypothetical protein
MGALGTNIPIQWNPNRGSTQKFVHIFLSNPFRVLDGNDYLPRVRCALPAAVVFNAFGVFMIRRTQTTMASLLGIVVSLQFDALDSDPQRLGSMKTKVKVH